MAAVGGGPVRAIRDDMARSSLTLELKRLAKLETAVRTFVAADSWCTCAVDHAASAKRCPCGYAQVRAALAAIDRAKKS